MGDHTASIPSSKYFFCVGAALLILGSILLCVLGFLVVYPHHVTLDWDPAWCRVTNATYIHELCSCVQPYDEREGCISKYPCLRISVSYNNTRNDTEQHGTLYRRWVDAFYQECSLYECGDEHWNLKTIRQFKRDYGNLNMTFACHSDPARADIVVLSRTSTSSVIHAVVWPSILLLGGSIVLLGMCLGCWKFEEDVDARTPVIKKVKSPCQNPC